MSKELTYELPLTTSTGRARIKRRKDEFGEPLKQEHKLSDNDYTEWQISYFMSFDTLWEKFKSARRNANKKRLIIKEYFSEFKSEDLVKELISFFETTEDIQRRDFKKKLKEIFHKHKQIIIVKEHKDNKTYVMYELADLFKKALKENIIKKEDINELLKFNEKDKIDIEKQYAVTRKSLSETISENFEYYKEKSPLFIKRINNRFFTEIQIKHKQKAVGYQGMIYFCVWVKYLLDNQGKTLVGRKANPNEKIKISLSKDDLFSIAKTFIITSKDHEWDMKTILKGLI